MESSNDKLSAKQIEDLLRISKVQLHYWGHLLDLKPLERSPRRGLAHVYSRDNLFCLALLQRLFQEFGLQLPVAIAVVKLLLREFGIEQLLQLSETTVALITPGPTVTLTTVTFPLRGPYLFSVVPPTSSVVGKLTVPLTDLKEIAHGPMT